MLYTLNEKCTLLYSLFKLNIPHHDYVLKTFTVECLLIPTWLTSPLTPNPHLDQYSVNTLLRLNQHLIHTWSTVGWELAECRLTPIYMYWLILDGTSEKISRLYQVLREYWSIDWVFIQGQSRVVIEDIGQRSTGKSLLCVVLIFLWLKMTWTYLWTKIIWCKIWSR